MVTLGDCSNGQGLFFKIEPCLKVINVHIYDGQRSEKADRKTPIHLHHDKHHADFPKSLLETYCRLTEQFI
jgi:hypothetical protein